MEELYLTILSRFPTPDEVKIAWQAIWQDRPPRQGRQAGTMKRREDWVDITWALINSTEFLYRH